MAEHVRATRASLRSPRAASVAGIAFALLLGVALLLVRVAVPAGPDDAGEWLEEGWRNTSVTVALYLVPFAGIKAIDLFLSAIGVA